MQLIEYLDVPVTFPNPVVTIGNYDGVHVGHRAIIEIVKAKARQISGTPMLMTFHPHPLHVLRPEKELPSITPIEEKKRLIEEAGIEVLLILPFTEELSQLAPESFVKELLVGKLATKGLVVGYDFRFGKGGRGDIEGMRKYAEAYGFFLEVVNVVTTGGEKVGSNKIRKLLQCGEVDKANLLLGRPYMIRGQVVHGKGRGRAIGFPTINVSTDFDLVPPNGVYVSEVAAQGRKLQSVTNIGCSPTFGAQERTIETFILDWAGDLYWETVQIFFHLKLREEIRYESVTKLTEQIERDIIAARRYFEGLTSSRSE
jgi:riboflavin kinase / FMN adenylyltransferase